MVNEIKIDNKIHRLLFISTTATKNNHIYGKKLVWEPTFEDVVQLCLLNSYNLSFEILS